MFYMLRSDSYNEETLHVKFLNSEGRRASRCDHKAFSSWKYYSLHMRRGQDTYTCDICLAVVFNSREEWESHRQIHFAGSFPCFVCNKVFTEAAGLKNHQDICCHHSNGLSKSQIHAAAVVTENCPFCRTILTSRNEMKAHIRSDHIDFLVYQCQHCDEICFGRQEFLAHKQYSHTNQYKCQLCSLEFSTKEELDTHLPTHKQMKTAFACEFCGTVYKTKEVLFSHKLTHSQPQPLTPQLQVQPLENVTRASTGISGGQNAVYHQVGSIPSRKEMFNCLVCQQKFNSKAKLDTHIHVIHKKTTPAARVPIPVTTSLTKITPTSKPEPNVNILYRCKSCNLLFQGEDKFQEHKRNVHQTNINYNFICKPCSSPFKTMSELKQHQSHKCLYKNSNTSLVYKPYSCSKCHKKFMLEGSLNLHYCTKVVKLDTKKIFKYTSEEDTTVTFVLTIA